MVLAVFVAAATVLACAPGPAPQVGTGFGAFLGSGAAGVQAISGFESFLGGREVTVGHTYLPGGTWAGIRGPGYILDPWTGWVTAESGRTLVLNVPMLAPNEEPVSDQEVSTMLEKGAAGDYDKNFRVLAERLVARGATETIIVLGWEMNGTTYTHRCGPNPGAWKAYWRSIVATMRSVPGQAFRFDFTPARGPEAIAWQRCYPGDDVVDIIGMDHYDMPPGDSFAEYIEGPYGLRAHAEFAAAHGKPISFPEWGLFRYGDRPQFVRAMHEWINSHNVVYQTISDYCPHGVYQCDQNPRSSEVYRELFGAG